MPVDLPIHRAGRRIGARLTILLAGTLLIWGLVISFLFSGPQAGDLIGVLLFSFGALIPTLICFGLRFWRLQIGDDGLRFSFGPIRYRYPWSKVTKVIITADPYPIFEFKTGVGGQLVIDTSTAADPGALAAELRMAHALFRPEALPGRDKPDFSWDLALPAWLAIVPIFFLPPTSNWIRSFVELLGIGGGFSVFTAPMCIFGLFCFYISWTFDGPQGLGSSRLIDRVDFDWIWRCGRPLERVTIHFNEGRPARVDSRALKFRRFRDTLLQVTPTDRCRFISAEDSSANADRRTWIFIGICLASSLAIYLLKPEVTSQWLVYYAWAAAPLVFILFMVRWMIWRKGDAAGLSTAPGTAEPARVVRQVAELKALVNQRFREAKVIKTAPQ